ncbi:unnamed protein product [Ceutorhynchus assimilis]|uniref:Carboxylic ester hydrolase n=1 Tax=Ceutorhynchus assimilis TaxID=467358 RepID=A0A9P0DMV7_9CUCU|nr:unnamed protein product [Ceutorhynchus assimilis]
MIILGVLAVLIVPRGILGQTIEEGETPNIRPTVTTPLGQIEGDIGFTVNLHPYIKFEGVPYAKPPVGELRFEEPQDVEPWVGTWEAKTITQCMTYDHFTKDHLNNYLVQGDEDCLYVNIYTHSISAEANLDVLVHIHGGAFMFGKGANYGPDIIMERDIVYVNFNYRLGALGFLSTEDDVLPGNLGLRDQIKALQWIKENIHYFGGNPNSVTIHGLSAGGASVHLHYLMPQSKGLFKNGISQSGCALNPWVLVENIGEKTAKIANLVGCPAGNSKETKECLKSKPAKQIVESVKEFQPFLYNPFSPLGVVVDGQWAKNPLLSDHPYNLLKQGKVLDLPWIISYTSAEGLYPAAEFWSEDQHLIDIDTKWNDIMPFVLHYNDSVDPELRDQVSQEIRKEYLGEKPVNRETYSALVDAVGDRLFVADTETCARLQNAATTSNIYSYKFNYRGATSKSTKLANTDSSINIGVCHADDTIYVCSFKGLDTQSTESDRKMSELFKNMFESFMLSGEPNITLWKPLSKSLDEFCHLKINSPDDLEMEYLPEIGQRSFWDNLPFNENHQFAKIVVREEL